MCPISQLVSEWRIPTDQQLNTPQAQTTIFILFFFTQLHGAIHGYTWALATELGQQEKAIAFENIILKIFMAIVENNPTN